MSREIKFRAAIYGQVSGVKKIDFDSGEIQLDVETESARVIDGHPWVTVTSHRRINEVDLMQFTGLHDRHGTPIYDGDIVSDGDGRWEVWWFSRIAGFALRTGGDSGLVMDGALAPNKTLEVVGNVYETPGLLEQK